VKETFIPHEIGIHSVDPELLRKRYRVSQGLVLLDPLAAEIIGYNEPESGVGVITPIVDDQDPVSSLRIPTDAELDAITADPNTKRVMQLVRLPRPIATLLLQECMRNDVDQNTPKYELAPSIIGTPSNTRFDEPGQLNVTVNPNKVNRFTGLPPKVGDHVDGYEDPNIALLAVNMGPGERWHRITPDLNRDTAGEKRVDRYQFMLRHPAPESIPVHWFKLQAPDDDYVEAIVNAPVSYVLHEGSTIGSDTPSRALFCMTEPLATGVYPSVV
jgi:hypothetical protein